MIAPHLPVIAVPAACMEIDPNYEFNAPTEYVDLNNPEHPGDEFFGERA